MKKTKLQSGNILIASFLTILLVFIVSLSFSTAYFYNTQELNGKINLTGFKVDYTGTSRNASGEMILKIKGESGEQDFNIEMADPTDVYEVVNPTISCSEKITPVFVRSKLIIKDYYNNELSEEKIKEVFAEIPTYSSSWVKGENWYYLSTTDLSGVDKLTTFAGENTIEVFENTKFSFNQTDNIQNLFQELKELRIGVRVEYIEAGQEGYDVWFNNKVEEDNEVETDKETNEIVEENKEGEEITDEVKNTTEVIEESEENNKSTTEIVETSKKKIIY